MAQPSSSDPPPGPLRRNPAIPSEEQRRKRAAVRLPVPPPEPSPPEPDADATTDRHEGATPSPPEPESVPAPIQTEPGHRGVMLVLLLLALVPAWWTARTVIAHAVNTPFRDDWLLVDHLEALHRSQVPWTELWRPVDGERSPLPQAIHLLALRFTGGDVRVDAWINLGCIGASSLGVLLLLARTLGWGWPTGLLYFVANLALFSPAQNLFAMRQAGVLIPVTCLIWSILLASRHGSTVVKFTGCAFLAAMAIGSGVHGLALLPAVPLLASMAVGLPCRIRPLLFSAAWGAAAVAALAFYLWGWNPAPAAAGAGPGADTESMPGLERGFALAFQLISAPLLEGWGWAGPAQRVATGALLATALLAMAAWALLEALAGRRRPTGIRCGPWLLLGGSGLLGLGILVATRISSLPPGQPLPAPTLNLGHAALPVLLGTLVPLHVLGREWMTRARRRPWWFLPALIHASAFGTAIGLQAESWFRGHEEIRLEHRERLRTRVALHLCELFPPANPDAFAHPSAEDLRRRARFLHENGYLQPPMLRDDSWPSRRVREHPLPILSARVDPFPDPLVQGRVFRVIARLPASVPGAAPIPAAGVLAAVRAPDDPTRYRPVARAVPVPGQPEAWDLDVSGVAPGEEAEVWAIDGMTLAAHRLEQRIRSQADGTHDLFRPTALPGPPGENP